MVSNEKYAEIKRRGLTLDLFFVLMAIHKNEVLPEDTRIPGYINLLTKRGYLKNKQLTNLALALVEEKMAQAPKPADKKNDFALFVGGLYVKLQEKLTELVGKKQVVSKIKDKGYSFLPNQTDLTKTLYTVVLKYKIGEEHYPLIEKCLLAYVVKCYKARNWFPVLQYYILKHDLSAMVTDMENFEEEDTSTANQTLDTII